MTGGHALLYVVLNLLQGALQKKKSWVTQHFSNRYSHNIIHTMAFTQSTGMEQNHFSAMECRFPFQEPCKIASKCSSVCAYYTECSAPELLSYQEVSLYSLLLID